LAHAPSIAILKYFSRREFAGVFSQLLLSKARAFDVSLVSGINSSGARRALQEFDFPGGASFTCFVKDAFFWLARLRFGGENSPSERPDGKLRLR
jgi:hypothetical protein